MNFSTNLVSFFRMIFQLSFAGQPPRAMRTGLIGFRNFPDPPGIVPAVQIPIYFSTTHWAPRTVFSSANMAGSV